MTLRSAVFAAALAAVAAMASGCGGGKTAGGTGGSSTTATTGGGSTASSSTTGSTGSTATSSSSTTTSGSGSGSSGSTSSGSSGSGSTSSGSSSSGSTTGCTDDALCTNGAGTYCSDATASFDCTVGSNGCLVASAPTTCAAGELCTGAAAAASCACPAVSGSAAGGGCAQAGDVACSSDATAALTCTTVGSCLVWQTTTDCGASQLACTTASGAPTCDCPANTSSDFYADSVSGSDVPSTDGGLSPTGVANPAGCRFGTLGHALSLANAAGPGARAIATGADATTPMSFTTQATGNSESFPLVVAGGVALMTDPSAPTGATFSIVAPASSSAAAIELGTAGEPDALLTGFTVVVGSATATGLDGIDVTAGGATLTNIQLQGLGATTSTGAGILATGASLTVSNGSVTGFGTGLSLGGSGTETISGTVIDSNGEGIVLLDGTATADGIAITNSTDRGITTAATAGQPTLTLTNSQVGNGPGTGITWSAGTLNLAGDVVSANGVVGLEITGGQVGTTAAPISSNNFDGNGLGNGGNASGIRLTAGALTLGQGNSASSNTGFGLAVVSGSVVASSGFSADSNTVDGVGVVGASSVTIANLDASNNGRAGVHAFGTGATVALAGGTFNGNASRGLWVEGSNAVVTGSPVFTNNGHGTVPEAGIRIDDGSTFTLGAANDPSQVADISASGTFGLNIRSANTHVFYANVHDNSGRGVSVTFGQAANSVANAIVELDHLTVTRNENGIVVEKAAPIQNSTADVLFITNASIKANNGVGLALGLNGGQNSGPVAADVEGSTIDGNHGVGVSVDQNGGGSPTAINFNGNVVSHNGVVNNLPTGGMVFTAGSVRNAGFASNQIFSNNLNQVSFNSGVWNIDPGSCLAANQIYCYPTGALGVSAGNNAVVDAQFNSWKRAPPQSGLDYSGVFVNAGTNNGGANYCPAVNPQVCP